MANAVEIQGDPSHAEASIDYPAHSIHHSREGSGSERPFCNLPSPTQATDHTLLGMSQQNLKLTYFGFGGRAEITRLTLAFSGVSFDDIRVSGPEFSALKPTLPLGQLPVMEVDGAAYCQSMAIARYVGRITNMYPTDALEALKVDELVESTMDAFNKYVEVNWKTPDEAEKAQKIKSFTHEDLPKIVGYLETKVEGKFFLGEKATIADMFLFDLYSNAIKSMFPDFKISAFPKVEAILANVAANAGVAAYLAKVTVKVGYRLTLGPTTLSR